MSSLHPLKALIYRAGGLQRELLKQTISHNAYFLLLKLSLINTQAPAKKRLKNIHLSSCAVLVLCVCVHLSTRPQLPVAGLFCFSKSFRQASHMVLKGGKTKHVLCSFSSWSLIDFHSWPFRKKTNSGCSGTTSYSSMINASLSLLTSALR